MMCNDGFTPLVTALNGEGKRYSEGRWRPFQLWVLIITAFHTLTEVAYREDGRNADELSDLKVTVTLYRVGGKVELWVFQHCESKSQKKIEAAWINDERTSVWAHLKEDFHSNCFMWSAVTRLMSDDFSLNYNLNTVCNTDNWSNNLHSHMTYS